MPLITSVPEKHRAAASLPQPLFKRCVCHLNKSYLFILNFRLVSEFLLRPDKNLPFLNDSTLKNMLLYEKYRMMWEPKKWHLYREEVQDRPEH